MSQPTPLRMTVTVLAAVVSACTTSTGQPATTATTTATSTTRADAACAGFTAQQFIGDWTSPDDPTTTTLAPDGALRSRGAGDESGTWGVRPIGQTPGSGQLTDDSLCVLWLHWSSPAPAFDAFYVPLKVTDTQLQLSYVGRGNTVTWIRAAGSH